MADRLSGGSREELALEEGSTDILWEERGEFVVKSASSQTD